MILEKLGDKIAEAIEDVIEIVENSDNGIVDKSKAYYLLSMFFMDMATGKMTETDNTEILN